MPSDLYQQPGFYRFNQDSLELVEHIVREEKTSPRSKLSVLDAMAGVGVIGIELSTRLDIERLSFNEIQPAFSAYISNNLRAIVPEQTASVFLCSLLEMHKITSQKYDLIAFNPPYFMRGQGRTSPDHQRDICRRMDKQKCLQVFDSLEQLLLPNGRAYFCCPESEWPQQKLKTCKKLNQRGDISFYCFVAADTLR